MHKRTREFDNNTITKKKQKINNFLNFFDLLDHSVLCLIFNSLENIKDSCNCSFVSKRWLEISKTATVCYNSNTIFGIFENISYDTKYQLQNVFKRKFKSKEICFLHSVNRNYYNATLLLIQKGVNFHYKDEEAFRACCRMGFFNVAQLLVQNGVNISAKQNESLRWAALNGRESIVKLLLENGANPSCLDNQALRWAKRNKHKECCRILIKFGADKNSIDNFEYNF